MARNKITDLNDHLFAQLERLNDESISPEEMKNEVEKAKAIEGIAKQIIDTNKLHLDRNKLLLDAYEKGVITNIDAKLLE